MAVGLKMYFLCLPFILRFLNSFFFGLNVQVFVLIMLLSSWHVSSLSSMALVALFILFITGPHSLPLINNHSYLFNVYLFRCMCSCRMVLLCGIDGYVDGHIGRSLFIGCIWLFFWKQLQTHKKLWKK